MFGLTSSEGNRGEDVKEYYFYLDATPSGSYMKMLYKYPQAAYPVPAAARRKPQARRRRHGIRAARHRRLRRGPLLRHRHRVRQGGSRRHLHPDRGVQPRAARPRSCTCCRTCGSATRGDGARSAGSEPVITGGPSGRGCQSLVGRRLERGSAAEPDVRVPARRRGTSTPRRTAPRSSRTTRPTRERSRTGARERQSVHEGRVSPPRRERRARPRQPRRDRHEGGAALHGHACRRGARRVWRLRLTPETLADPLARRRARSSPSAATRPTSSTPRSIRRRRPPTRSCVQRQALAGMLWTQADLPVRRGRSGWTGDNPQHAAAGVAQAHPQPALAAPELDAHPVDAGQVGVPVVRGVGSGVPLRRARARRSRLREGEPLGAALRAVPASQRADPGVRVGVLGPESAGACLGVLARLQRREGAHGQGRHGVPGEVLPEAADQLRLVGQQGRQPGHERVRRGLSRPRQHHGGRSQREAARRRDPRAVGRDRLDGLLLPAHDADRHRARRRPTRSTSRWRRSSSSTSSTSAAR